MAENPPANGATANNARKTNNRNFFRMRNRVSSAGPRPNTFSVLIPQTSNTVTNQSGGGALQPLAVAAPQSISFQIDKKNGPYSGWKLYFPEIGS